MFKADVMHTWKDLNQSFMPHNLLRARTQLQVAAKQLQLSSLVAGLCVPVWEGQIPDPSEVMTRFSWASQKFDRGPKGTDFW